MTEPRIHRIFRAGEHWCVVADNGMGHYLAYVSVPEGHPWHGLHYDTIEELYTVNAHGGLTFSDERDWDGWQGAVDGCPPGWYVGMDFGHWQDAPIPGSYMAEAMSRIGGQIDLHQWDVDSVSDQARLLARSAQAAAAVEV